MLDASDNNCDINTNGELEVIKKYIPDARVIFDVGLEKGTWTKRALAVNPTAEYHCFEPNTDVIPDDLPANVIVNKFALGKARTKSKPLYVFGKGCDSLYNRPLMRDKLGLKEIKTVEVFKLDFYCKKNNIEHIDFLKIDTEGNELNILQGAKRMLNEGRIKTIQFEYGGCYTDAGTTLNDIYKFIAKNTKRYSFFKIYPDHLANVPIYDADFETFQYSNWLIVLD